MKRSQEGKRWTVKLVVQEGTSLLTTRQVARRTFHKLDSYSTNYLPTTFYCALLVTCTGISRSKIDKVEDGR